MGTHFETLKRTSFVVIDLAMVLGAHVPFESIKFVKAYLMRWLDSCEIGGIRMDSVNSVANCFFLQEHKDWARVQ